jgi:hypothetical protein
VIKLSSEINDITDITYLGLIDDNEYVYDIETVTGNFQAGIGQLIVKNTDSIFVNFTDEIKRRNPGREFSEKELLIESIKIGQEAAANINSHMKAPQNIEYEKTFWPFCIFSKKRYFGNKYEHNPEKYKQTSMGIVLKRRDNAPIVKTIYGGVIDIILNKRNIEDSKKYFYDCIKNLLDGKVDLSELVISKTVKNDYANPTQIAHKVLADRMGERDPGNKPQSNDRIPYCYIDSSNLLCKVCHKKVSPDKCKCINCMNLYCSVHLKNHRESCLKICRFCKADNKTLLKNHVENCKHQNCQICNEIKSGNDEILLLINCNTCKGWYCSKCNEKHKLRTDKYKVVHNDKCKKELTNKLLQGDTIEHPLYIKEKNLKIDYNYYLTNQIQKPVYQIFELVMKNPESIIAELVRKMNNLKNGNHSIKAWLTIGKKSEEQKKEDVEEKKVESIEEAINKININESKDNKDIIDSKDSKDSKIIIDEEDDDEDGNMLDGKFEEDIIENLDDVIDFDIIDIE